MAKSSAFLQEPSGGMDKKAPSTNIQAPKKFQAPNPK
jgi:hypothetical protein